MKPRSSSRARLSRSAEFERVYRQGRSTANRHLVLYAFPELRRPSARGWGCRCRARSGARWSATASSGCCGKRSHAPSPDLEARPGRGASWPAPRPASWPSARASRAWTRRSSELIAKGGLRREPGDGAGDGRGELDGVAASRRPQPRGAPARARRARDRDRPDRRLPAGDLAGDSAPLQVRAHVLALRGRGDPRVRHTSRAWCWRRGACSGAIRGATAGTIRWRPSECSGSAPPALTRSSVPEPATPRSCPPRPRAQ